MTAMRDVKGVSKEHWMNCYLERLNSKEGLSAEEIYDEENVRRTSEGIPLLKYNSIGRTLNTFGYPKAGTSKNTQLAEAKPVRIGVFLKDLKRKVANISELINEEKLSHAEQEFIWLYIEDYPESQIADMLHLDATELDDIKQKLQV